MNKTIKYKYAYDVDQNNKLVSIDDVVEYGIRDHTFICLNCGNELIPAIGKKNTPHFKHKVDVECEGESYLHKLAKLRFKDKFYSNTPFFFSFMQTIICDEKVKCPFSNDFCKLEKESKYSFHKYFDTCELEKSFKCDIGGETVHIIPDITLSNSKKPNQDPLFIEIWNTHKSEEKKLDLKYRIIEVRVFSESDIDYFIEHGLIESSPWKIDKRRKELCIQFYNFSAKTGSIACPNINKFVLYKSRKVYLHNYLRSDMIFKKLNNESQKEILMKVYEGSLFRGLSYLISKGYKLNNCLICKYYGESRSIYATDSICYCHLHEKFSTPIFPDQLEAEKCQYFRYEPNMWRFIKEELSQLSFIELD